MKVSCMHCGQISGGGRGEALVALWHVAGYHGRHRHVPVVVLHPHDALIELCYGLEVGRHACISASKQTLEHCLVEAPPQLVQLA